MRYKENWEKSRERLCAFWERELVDRCCISVSAPDRELPALLEPLRPVSEEDIFRQRTDPEAMIRWNRLIMEHTFYGGEAFPSVIPDLGAAGHAGFFAGARYRIGDTVWFFPSLEDPDQLRFDRESFLYQKTLELARALAQDSAGDYVIAMPDTTGNADALAHLMGSEPLLISMLEEPETVQRALHTIELAYERIIGKVYDIVREANGGGSSVGWLHTWAPGMHCQMQCDMSVMISRPLFDRFILPELVRQSEFLDCALYHLDGVEQIRHLDSLLSIPRLRAIQWTQVEGQPPCTEYIPQLQRIQQAGKGLIIHVTREQIEPLMENLSSRGLLLLVSARDREEAESVVKLAERLTHD